MKEKILTINDVLPKLPPEQLSNIGLLVAYYGSVCLLNGREYIR